MNAIDFTLHLISTVILEAKMDQKEMQEWQKYSRGHIDAPPLSLLHVLQFVDLQAHDTENTIHVELKRPAVTPNKKTTRVSYVTTKV